MAGKVQADNMSADHRHHETVDALNHSLAISGEVRYWQALGGLGTLQKCFELNRNKLTVQSVQYATDICREAKWDVMWLVEHKLCAQ